MCSAAELDAVVAHAYDSYDIAVLFTEDGHCAELLCLVDRHLFHLYRQILIDLLIYDILDLLDLLSSHRLEVVEVESEIVLVYIGTCLHDVITQNISECLLHEVCSGVASGDLVSSDRIYLKAYSVTFLDAHSKTCILRVDNVQIDAVFLYNVNDAESVFAVNDNTGIVYLSAACSVERSGFEDDELAVLIEVSDIQYF